MNYTTMKEVTKDEFFGIINEGKLDVLVRPETKEPGHWYPHTTEFKFRDGTVFGKVVEDFHDGEHYPVVEKYYINEIRMDISGRNSSPVWTLEWQID